MFDPPRLARGVLAALLAVVLAGPAAAQDGGRAAAETLARTQYLEGVPYAEAVNLGDAGVARLAEMLGEPAERSHHAQILEILGMSGRPGAYAAIAAVAADHPEGEVDRIELRKRVALRAALGHLARHDERALADLVGEASGDRKPAGWHCGRYRGARLDALLRRSAVAGLGLSGRPGAARALRRLQRDLLRGGVPAADPDLAAQVEEALALHHRMATDGADAVLRASAFDRSPR